MTTKHDPWVNLLRTTVACFAAGVGGADAVTVQPFDAALGPARLVLPADRPQHAEPADRGGAPRPRPRSGRRVLVRRVADRVAGAGGLGLVHRDRAGRRPGRGAGLRPGARPDRRRLGRPGAAPGAPARMRSPASASSPTWPRSCRPAAGCVSLARRSAAGALPTGGLPRVRAAQEFEELRDRRAAGPPGSTWPRSARSPGTRPGPRSRATSSRRAGSRRRRATASPGSPRRTRRSPASAAPTRTTRSTRPRWRRSCGRPGPRGVAGRQAGPRDRRGRRYVFAGCDALDVLRTVHEQAGVKA